MSAFLQMIRRRFERTNGVSDPVPWHLDEKYTAYEFVRARGWNTPRHVRCDSPAHALEVARSFGRRFVVKQPNRHSTKGIYVLEHLGGERYLELLSLREIRPQDIRPDGPVPDYWLAEECVSSNIAGKPIPLDYKFYCFDGRPALIVQIDRNTSPPQVAMFDGAFLPLEYRRHFEIDPNRWLVGHHVLPLHAARLLAMASDLSAATESRFVSVDAYDGPEGPVFGEFTFAAGAPDVGMYRLAPEPLLCLDALSLGIEAPLASGMDLDWRQLMADVRQGGPLLDPALYRRVAASASFGDKRYGRVMSERSGRGRLAAHFALAARMIGLLNGDGEQAFYIQTIIGRREGFVAGDGRREEFQQQAWAFHSARAVGNPWHATRAAEVRLARGEVDALKDVQRLADEGFLHAQRVLAAHKIRKA